ncbi:Uncharacterised protein [Staphylococcus delphini]|nr:Uncharacterised protein [Staphylococcus delphini]
MENRKAKLWLGVVLLYLSLSVTVNVITTSFMGFVITGMLLMSVFGLNLIIENLDV